MWIYEIYIKVRPARPTWDIKNILQGGHHLHNLKYYSFNNLITFESINNHATQISSVKWVVYQIRIIETKRG